LRDLADQLRDKLGSGVVVLGAALDGKANLLVAVTSDLTSRIKAGELVAKLAPMVGGRGGGKPELAQAGGPQPEKLNEALAAVAGLVA
jgi:alanyl-tRNA synthetase